MNDLLAATDHAAGKTPLPSATDIDPGPLTEPDTLHDVLPPPLASLYAALAKAQGEFPEIPKNRVATIRPREGSQWSFKYSDLADLIGTTRPALAANGLGFYQHPVNDWKEVRTIVFHEGGATIAELYPVKHRDGSKMHPGQDFAISWALARRYALSAMLGVAAEETIEGDKSTTAAGENFEDPERDGIISVRGAKNTQDATPAELARSYADAIEEQIGDVKSVAGLPGVWKRNQDVIDVLQDHFQVDYENVIACYAAREAELKADAP